MTTPNFSNNKIILAKPQDWDNWLFFVRTRATMMNIWHLVNPAIAIRPTYLLPPTRPPLPQRDPDGTIPAPAQQTYKMDSSTYKMDCVDFDRQQKAFSDLIAFIQETIASENITHIAQVESHPWDILRALSQRLAPSDEGRAMQIKEKYLKLRKGPGTQNIDQFLDEWLLTYRKAKDYGIAEVTGKRPVRDLLLAIDKVNPYFAQTRLSNLEQYMRAKFLN